MKLKLNPSLKPKLSTTLKSWLPLLQASGSEVEEIVNEIAAQNPFVESKMKNKKALSDFKNKKSISDKIEQLNTTSTNFYEDLLDQLDKGLFPTDKSRDIAECIIENLDSSGLLDVSIQEIAKECGATPSEVEDVRSRFRYLEPAGIGAQDVIESLHFQLDVSECSDAIYDLARKIIDNLQGHNAYKEEEGYKEAMKLISGFSHTPTLEYSEDSKEIIPDVFIEKVDGVLSVRLNDSYIPTIKLLEAKDISGVELVDLRKRQNKLANKGGKANESRAKPLLDKEEQDFIKAKLKEGRDLIDAIAMRGVTVKKICLMIVDYQYEFFNGGEKKPMKLKDIAEEFKHSPSTISRAISNKYLECDRGIYELKSFFTTAIENSETSNSTIKDFIASLIEEEDRKKPLSDKKILDMVEEKFEISMVRRTIAKYRSKLEIPSSSDRKKFYELKAP